jgi:NADH pyrophosphatase NudC (nudix superfamily)
VKKEFAMQDQEKERIMYEATILFLIRNGQVLLARKVKKIGKGKWNGYGGEIEPGETQRHACVREIAEESCGIRVDEKDLIKVADIRFHNTTEENKKFVLHASVFFAYRWEGEASSTNEMADPTWFDFDKVPYDQMIPGDARWLPIVLSGKKIVMKIEYSPHQAQMIGEAEIQYVDSLLEE